MKDLIEALSIFLKYCTSDKFPTHCEHDVLTVVGVGCDDLTDAEYARVEELGFHWSHEHDSFISYRFGSA